MRRTRSLRALGTAAVTTLATAGMVAVGGGTAQAATPLPEHVFAPYFESWTGQSPADAAAASGAKNLTLAFLQTAAKGSCTVYWNGDTGTPVADSVFGADIAALRANGGDVIPSFGGYAAAWDAGAVYTGGDQVAHEGHTWQAKWWTRGEEPGTTGQWGVWKDLGTC